MSSVWEFAAEFALELLIAAVALGLLYRLWGAVLPIPHRELVLEFQRGVVLRKGVVEKVLGTGTHWISPGRTVVLCDMRKKPFQVSGQHVLSADGMNLRISMGGEYRICDPAAFVIESTDAFSSFYLEVCQALRVAASEFQSEAVLSAQAPVATRIRELVVPRGAQLGMEIAQLDVFETVPLGWVRQA